MRGSPPTHGSPRDPGIAHKHPGNIEMRHWLNFIRAEDCPWIARPLAKGRNIGAPEGIRTPNLLIRSQMLYPLSYGRDRRGLSANLTTISAARAVVRR